MKIVFNTGRLYQRDGQIITAVYNRETLAVLFMDHSRGIAGEIQTQVHLSTEAALMDYVMRHYDRNDYSMSMDAMQITRDTQVKPLPWRLP